MPIYYQNLFYNDLREETPNKLLKIKITMQNGLFFLHGFHDSILFILLFTGKVITLESTVLRNSKGY